MPLGPAQNYVCRYNGYTLPGYVQSESLPSDMAIADHIAPYADGSYSEYTGLQNKVIELTLKVWEQDYATCKQQVQQAATMVRSKRDGYGNLYLQYTDRHYEVLTPKVGMEANAGENVRILQYTLSFQGKPWLIGDTINTFSNTTLVTTTGRTINDGGWTYANAQFSGTNVTISGYTTTEPLTGYLSVSGAVTNMIVDSENFTATVGGVNKNTLMRTADYRLFVGPEVTNFAVTGASACTITYYNRWYI